jgi:hypothetical protein
MAQVLPGSCLSPGERGIISHPKGWIDNGDYQSLSVDCIRMAARLDVRLPHFDGVQLLIIVWQEIVCCEFAAMISAALKPSIVQNAG